MEVGHTRAGRIPVQSVLRDINLERWSCRGLVVAGRYAWQHPLFNLAAAWAGLGLSRLLGKFDLIRRLGYEFEPLVIAVFRLRVVDSLLSHILGDRFCPHRRG